jgi:SET domain-containing protein
MLLIKTTVKESKIPNAGVGVFLAEPVKKGQIIWRFEPTVDIIISAEKMSNLHPDIQRFHKKYSYRTVINNQECYVFCSDNGRFMNHSETPNTDDNGNETCMALMDLPEGEEITCDYRSFDLDSKEKLDF